MARPEHTSATQLSTYATCPQKYAYRYVLKVEPEERSPALILGSVVHSVLGWFFGERLVGEEPTIAMAKELVEADMDAAIDGPPVRWGRWTRVDFQEHAERLVGYVLAQHADLPVVAIEQRFTAPLHHPETGEPLPRKLLGYLDFVLTSGDVLELKTARSAYDEVSIASSLQFAAYSAALPTLGLSRLSVWVLLKKKQPSLQKLVVGKNEERAAWFSKAAAEIEESIAAGRFYPAPGFGCSYCEYRSRCLGLSKAQSERLAA